MTFIKSQIEIIKKAYDKNVDDYHNGIDELDLLPEEFKNSQRLKEFQTIKHSCNSGEPDINEYLNPKPCMNFLDVGSCANLIGHKLYEWPSTYYGIDISPKLIKVTENFVNRNNIKIGGLCVAEAANLPFESKFMDIAAVIGIIEYFDIQYIKIAIRELHRVLKPQSRMVIDMPNLEHPDVNTMIEYETYLGRPRFNLPTKEQFEAEMRILFSIDKVNDSQIMTKYFVRTKE